MSFIAGPAYVNLPRSATTWVVQDLLPVGGLLNIFGQPKRGKSYLALQIASAVSDQDRPEVLGFPVITSGTVAYLQIDTPRTVWGDRINELIASGMNFERVYFVDSELVPYPFDILREGFGWLEQNLKMMPIYPLVLIVDTIREAHSGDENDSGHMRNVVNLIAQAARPASVILISHARKEWGDSSDLMSDNRGSSYIAGRMDCVLKVNDNSLIYQGRTVGEARIQVARTEGGVFVVNDAFDLAARDVLLTSPFEMSLSQKAKLLNERYPKKSPEACRSILRRLAKAISTDAAVPLRKIDLG